MGEELSLFPLEFNGSIRVEARPEKLSAETGAILLREVIERIGITRWLKQRLEDPRRQELVTHPIEELLRTAVILLGQGWRDQDDADALRDDAALRMAVSNRRGISPLEQRPREEGKVLPRNPEVPDGLASQPTLSRLGRALSTETNREVLREAIFEVAARRMAAERKGHRERHLTIDVDSLPIEVHGHQPGSAYNGHYHARVFHPLVASVAGSGDLLDVRLREGNVHTAEGAVEFVLPLIEQAEKRLCQVAALRIDAGFPEDKLLSALEERAKPTPYVARVRNNKVLDAMAELHLRRPPGRRTREPRTWFHEMQYQAKSWSRPRRVVLVVLERAGELHLHHFWLITNWTSEQMSGEELLEMYRERGSAENHMGELMDVFDPALSSTPRSKSHYRGNAIANSVIPGDSFAQNEARLLLNALAYNIVHVARRLVAELTGEGWSLRRVRERVLRVASRVLVHGRRVTVVISTQAAALWRALLLRLGRFSVENV
jgi:hypothetical protein